MSSVAIPVVINCEAVDGDVPGGVGQAPCQPSDVSANAAGNCAGKSTGTLGKALTVLDVVAGADRPLRFTEILNQVDLPRGTLHRQLANLLEEGLVTLTAENCYEPGLRLLTLAARTWSRSSLRSVAEPHLRKLNEATGETAHLGVINGIEVVYLDKLESRQNVRMHSQVGNASPLYCTGIGKAMLALLPKAERAERIERMDMRQFTASTLSTPAALEQELGEIARTGIAYDREEHEPGIFCIAAGIKSEKARVVAGISVTVPTFRLEGTAREIWTGLVYEAARAIEQDIDVKLGPRAGE